MKSEGKPWLFNRLDAMDRGDVTGARDVLSFIYQRLRCTGIGGSALPEGPAREVEILSEQAKSAWEFMRGYCEAERAKPQAKRKKRA